MQENHPPPRAALHSVGCKLNQFEAQLLRQALEDRGYLIVDFAEPADVYILNSCTVTSRTDRECRRLARGARTRNPHACIVMTGCYAEVEPAELARQGLVDLLVGNRDKAALADLIDQALRRPSPPCDSDPPLLREFRGHTRAFVKVQEGCAGGCTYCIISRARGPETSVPSAVAVEQVRLLAARHPEVVLIGTHLGRYGRERPPRTGETPVPPGEGETDLAGLVERLCALPELGRLRLSSLEPLEVTPRVQELVVAGGRALAAPDAPGRGKVCRHLHLPLQSGCDAVLRRMGRPYAAGTYAALVSGLGARQPGLAVGADVIVGFPGETEAEFAETCGFLEALPLAYLHVFTFSPRPGTPAADMPDQVPAQAKKERNHALRALSERKRAEFAAAQVGSRLEVVLETGEDGRRYGLSDNYLQVDVAGEAGGGIVAVRIAGVEGCRLRGVVEAALP